jgi:hypothetical protein
MTSCITDYVCSCDVRVVCAQDDGGDVDGDDTGVGEGGRGAKEDGVETEDDKLFLEAQRRLIEEARDRKRNEFGDEGEAARLQHEGFRQGLYVRILLRRVPVEFVRSFDPSLPVILGGLAASESALGFVRARIKRHRWHKRILKSNNPIIFSVRFHCFSCVYFCLFVSTYSTFSILFYVLLMLLLCCCLTVSV